MASEPHAPASPDVVAPQPSAASPGNQAAPKSNGTALKSRVEKLEGQVAELTAAMDTLSRVIRRFVVDQQMASALPQIAAAVKGQMESQIAAPGGLDAYLASLATPSG